MPRKNYKIAIVFLIISWGNLTLNYNIGSMKEVQNEPSLSNKFRLYTFVQTLFLGWCLSRLKILGCLLWKRSEPFHSRV